jgi:hypothetical protein
MRFRGFTAWPPAGKPRIPEPIHHFLAVEGDVVTDNIRDVGRHSILLGGKVDDGCCRRRTPVFASIPASRFEAKLHCSSWLQEVSMNDEHAEIIVKLLTDINTTLSTISTSLAELASSLNALVRLQQETHDPQ